MTSALSPTHPPCKNPPNPYIRPRVPERLIKIDAEIWDIQQKLKALPAIEDAAELKNKLDDLTTKRMEILDALEKAARERAR